MQRRGRRPQLSPYVAPYESESPVPLVVREAPIGPYIRVRIYRNVAVVRHRNRKWIANVEYGNALLDAWERNYRSRKR